MSITVKNMIIDAYKRTGRLSDRVAQTLDANRAEAGLQELNDIIQFLNAEEYFPFTIKRYEVPIVTLKNTFTLGLSSSDFNTVPRPAKISSMYFKSASNAIAVNLMQVSVNDIDQYKVSTISTGMPRYFAFDAGYPEASVYFNICPQTGSTIILTMNNTLPEYNINDTLTIPPEYTDLIKWHLTYNLAVRAGMEANDILSFDKERNRARRSVESKNSALKKRTWNDRNFGSLNNILNLGNI